MNGPLNGWIQEGFVALPLYEDDTWNWLLGLAACRASGCEAGATWPTWNVAVCTSGGDAGPALALLLVDICHPVCMPCPPDLLTS